jgi:hypothetical protein
MQSWRRVIRRERRVRIGRVFTTGEEIEIVGVFFHSPEEVSEVVLILGLAIPAGRLVIFLLIVLRRSLRQRMLVTR